MKKIILLTFLSFTRINLFAQSLRLDSLENKFNTGVHNYIEEFKPNSFLFLIISLIMLISIIFVSRYLEYQYPRIDISKIKKYSILFFILIIVFEFFIIIFV